MVLNNKGQVLFYSFMLGLTLVVLALALAPAIKQVVDSARNSTTEATIWNGTDYVGGQGLDCGNPAISYYDKAACISSDLTIFQFIGIMIFIAGSIITARIIFQ